MTQNPVGLMGILNVTPDSFSDGGLYFDPEKAINHTQTLFEQGADFVDIGAESTRPEAVQLSPDKEWQRLKPILGLLIGAYPGQISLDTYHPETLERAITEAGSVIANDVTCFSNPRMVEIVAKHQIRCILSHLPEKFDGDIQAAHQGGKIDSVTQVVDELLKRRDHLIAAGIPPELIILDPGIGFGKTMKLNWRLLEIGRDLPSEITVLIGYSKKRFLYTSPVTGKPIPHLIDLKDRASNAPEDDPVRIEHDAFIRNIHKYAAEACMSNYANILRVHDVAAHREFIG